MNAPRPVLIFQAPSAPGDYTSSPLMGGQSLRLARASGWKTPGAPEKFIGHFERLILIPEYLGEIVGYRDGWCPRPEARPYAQALRNSLAARTVVMVGRAVADAFFMGAQPLLTWREDFPAQDARSVIVPHPDAELWWEETGNRENLRRFFRDFLGYGA
jgi:hypothetical protein